MLPPFPYRYAKTIKQWKGYQAKKGKETYIQMLDNLEEDGGDDDEVILALLPP